MYLTLYCPSYLLLAVILVPVIKLGLLLLKHWRASHWINTLSELLLFIQKRPFDIHQLFGFLFLCFVNICGGFLHRQFKIKNVSINTWLSYLFLCKPILIIHYLLLIFITLSFTQRVSYLLSIEALEGEWKQMFVQLSNILTGVNQ